MTSSVLVDRGLRGARWRRGVVRPLALAVAAAAVLAAALAAPLAAPAAAATCPNDAYRTGPSAHLPDCRAYELVSPADKGANTLLINRTNGNVPVYEAASGDAVIFSALTPLPGSVSGRAGSYVADRSAGGWTARTLVPADCVEDPSGITGPTRLFSGLSRDFSQEFVVDPQNCVDPRDQAGDDIYALTADGTYTWISQDGQVKTDDVDARFAGVSGDGSRVWFTSPQQFFPAVDGDRLPGSVYAPTPGLYEHGPDGLHEVGLDANGDLLNICGTALAGRTDTAQPFSSDGRVVFFTPTFKASEPECDYAHGGGQLFARIDHSRTVEISRSVVDPSAAPTGPVSFLTATPDGRHVLFTSPDQLVADSAAADGGLYRYDLSPVLDGTATTGTLTFLSPGPADTYARFYTAVWISNDGQVAYVTTVGGPLPAGGVAGQTNLYRIDGTDVEPVYGSSTTISLTSTQVSEDLTKMAYQAKAPDGTQQLYLYDADDPGAAPTCVSCPPAGLTSTGTAAMRTAVGSQRPLTLGRESVVTNDGRVFFGTRDRLSVRDVNDAYDVYEYADGEQRLLSAGTGSNDSLLIGVSGPDARDVFFSTNDSLVGADTDDGDQDIYDARVGGGFAEPVAPAPCRGTGCRGPVPGAPSLAAAGTVAFAGSGNVVVGTTGSKRGVRKVRAPRRRVVRGHAFRVKVRVPSAGRITVTGRAVRRAHRVAGKRGAYVVRVRLTKHARRALARRHLLHLRVRVVFRPRSGARSSTVVRVTVRRPKGGR